MLPILLAILITTYAHNIYANGNFAFSFVCKSSAGEQVRLNITNDGASANELSGSMTVMCDGRTINIPVLAEVIPFPPENLKIAAGKFQVMLDFPNSGTMFDGKDFIMEGTFAKYTDHNKKSIIDMKMLEYNVVPKGDIPEVSKSDKFAGVINYDH